MYQNLASGGEGGQDPESGQFGLPGAGAGGAICNVGTLTLQSCTIVGNEAQPVDYPDDSCGGVCNTDSTFTFGNCIIANNIGSDPDMGGDNEGFLAGYPARSTFIDQGYNLISRGNNWGNWDGYVATDLVGTIAAPWDPLLGPLQYNGGQTETMAPLPGSPVIDNGNSFGLATDQRGSVRPYDYPSIPNAAGGDGSDIGAYEVFPTRPNISILANLGSVNLYWSENEPGTGPTNGGPFYGLQFQMISQLGLGAWTPFMGPVRIMSNIYIGKAMLVSAPLIFRLSGPATNVNFIPPAVTTYASDITSHSTALNGSTTPIGNNTLYWFVYGLDTNYGQTTPTNSLSTSTNLSSLADAIGGLSPLTLYHFQLVVTDSDGTQFGGDQTFTTGSAIPPPEVNTYAATSITTNSAVLNGGINGNGESDAAYFEYGLDTTYGSSNYTNQFFGSGLSQNFSTTISGLTALTTYHFRAVGSTLAGQGYGADATFTTAAFPPTVQTLSATSITHGTAVLNATVNPNGVSTTAYFQYGTTTGYGSSTTQTGVSSFGPFNASLSGLPANTTFHFRIVASSSAGVSYGADTDFTTLGD
jgi:hypothetical protein